MSKLQIAKKKLVNSEKAFRSVLTSDIRYKQFMSSLFLEIDKNEKVALSNNLLQVAKDTANFGLIVGGGAGQAYIIPYYSKKEQSYVANLIIGYKGYIAKLEEQGYSVEVEMVTHEELTKGRFEEVRGTNPQIIHHPIRSGIRGKDNIALAYCIISKAGISPKISVLSREEIEEIAKTDKWVDGKKVKALGNVWTQDQRLTDYGQMCLKTVIRNCAKKTNCALVNEMSNYEGEQEQAIVKDVTPKNIATLDDFKDLEKAKEENQKKDIDNQEEIVLNADGNNEVRNEQ